MSKTEKVFGEGRINIPDMQSKTEETSEVSNKEQNPNQKIEEVPNEPHRIIRPESPAENLETVDSSLNPENKNFFKKMSEGGRAIAGQVFEAAGRTSEKTREGLSKIPGETAEGIYNIPGVARILGKMEITYNQFWADKHEEKALGLKDKMDNFDLKTKTLEGAQKDLEEKIKAFKKSGFPVGSLDLGLRDIERQKEEIAKKRDVIQSRFEARDSNRKLYINERDRVADKLINRYEKKLQPFEKTIEDLKISRDQLDLASTIAEIKNEQKEEEYKKLEQDIKVAEESLRASGKKEWTIGRDKTLKLVRAEIIKGRKEIAERRESITKERFELNRKIAEVDKKANPLRDKKREFVRIKQRRPIDTNVKPREREKNTSFEEESKDYKREVSPEEIPSGTFEDGAEEIEDLEIKEVLPLPVLISIWNNHLKASSKVENFQSKLINVKDFVKAQQMFGEVDLSFKDFKKILESYYDFKKISIEKNAFGKDFGNFEDKSKIFKNAFVQWVSGGSEIFTEPRRVTGFSDDGKFAFVEGTKTGIPVSELESLG